jgi:hypothetical protein
MDKYSGFRQKKTAYQKLSPNQKVFYLLLVVQTISFATFLILTWVDEELILPNIDSWIPFASPKIIAGFLESFWLIILFILTTRFQIVSWRRIKLLEGILPICSYCKKIRDKQGKWNQVESYVSDKTDANFSHGICPNCIQVNFGDIINKP